MGNLPLTGKACGCRKGEQRDNCSRCEGTGKEIDWSRFHREKNAGKDEEERERREGLRPPRHTPWGNSDDETKVADGLWSVSTPSHGGIWMSAARRAEYRAIFNDIWDAVPDGPWLEEDEQWEYAALAWPREMRPAAVFFAVRSKHPRIEEWHAKNPEPRRVAAEFVAQHGRDYYKGGGGTNGSGWDFRFYRVDGEGKREVRTKDYPTSANGLFTEAELDALSVELTLVRAWVNGLDDAKLADLLHYPKHRDPAVSWLTVALLQERLDTLEPETRDAIIDAIHEGGQPQEVLASLGLLDG